MSGQPEQYQPNINSIITTDPGIDDMFGVIAAIALNDGTGEPAFVATYGNAQIDQTFANLRGIAQTMTLYNRSGTFTPPVVVAGDGILQLERQYGTNLDFIHGNGAMEGMGLGIRPIHEGDRARNLYAYLESGASGTIDLLSYGALTELPKILLNPKLRDKVRSITVMGGTFFDQGNVESDLEANTRHDPPALRSTIRAANQNGITITMVPLRATQNRYLELTPARMETIISELQSKGSYHIAEYIQKLAGPGSTYFNHYVEHTRDRRSHSHPFLHRRFHGPAIHDLTALMVLLHPELFLIIDKCRVKVTLSGEQKGSVGFVSDYMNPDGFVNVAMGLAHGRQSADLYWQYFTQILAKHYK